MEFKDILEIIEIIEAIDILEIIEGIEIIIIIIICITIIIECINIIDIICIDDIIETNDIIDNIDKVDNIETSVGENHNFVIFSLISTICISNQSWDHSKFKFDIRSYDLLFKIMWKNDFSVFRIGEIADSATLTESCG